MESGAQHYPDSTANEQTPIQRSAKPFKPRTVVYIFAAAIWLICVIAGFKVLLGFQTDAGAQTPSPDLWPANTSIKREPSSFRLVMFVHPQCPCTVSSIAELADVMTHCRQLKATVVFVKPKGFTDDWAKSKLWQQASSIPNVSLLVDNLGAEARKFGAETSGQTMLYTPAGALVFSGGITPGRGHEGDSAGVDSIKALVAHKPAQYHHTQVFGCSLINVP